MDGFDTALIDGTKSRAADAQLEKKRRFLVQSTVPFPRHRVLQYFTPEKVDDIVRCAGVSESGWRLSGFHVGRRPKETSDPWAERAAEGAFLSYFGPFSLPYIVYRDARDLFGDRLGRQSYVTMRFTSEEERQGTPGQDMFMTGNPQIIIPFHRHCRHDRSP